MYRPFFQDNIFAYIEFIGLLILFIFLIYRNINSIYVNYFHKKTTRFKIILLITLILLNSLIYIILDTLSVVWMISIAINAIIITLIIYLAISIFYGNKND